MKIERGENTNIQVSRDTHVVGVDTTLTETRRTLNFTYSDASREKENLMIKEFAKTGLSLGASVTVGLQGLDQIIQGFNNTNIEEMGRGAEIVLLASFLLPLTKRFYQEAKLARREKKKIEQSQKSS